MKHDSTIGAWFIVLATATTKVNRKLITYPKVGLVSKGTRCVADRSTF